MQFGKTLVGAIIGAAVGIALLVVVHRLLGWDRFWLAIPFAFLVGLGVRLLVSTSGHASYGRGVLTMLIAMAAYFGGWMVVVQDATSQAAKVPAKPAVSDAEIAADAEATGKDGKDSTDESTTTPTPPPTPARTTAAPKTPPLVSTPGSNWDIIWLAIAAFIAYELGRGSGASSPAVVAEQPAPVPMGTHPDA